MITDEEFLDWYDGVEGFALRSERAIEELEPSNMLKLRQWLFAAFEAGRASARYRKHEITPPDGR